jgi:Zn-dependent peptidase ImmA (M78 family)
MFNPVRLEIARKRRGLTKVALSRRAGLSVKALSDLASGRTTEPSPDAIDAIASVTRFPTAFFYLPDIDEPDERGVSFRALSKMTSGERSAAIAAGALAFELNAWIEQRFELPAPHLPDLRDLAPGDAAIALRVHWGIGTRPIGNMVHFLESEGVRVFSLAERSRRLDAYSLWHRERPFVFLNTMKTPEHSRMDAAHELGHLVLHRHGVPRGRDAEKDAQAFGAAFLMPEASVRSLVQRLITPTLAELAQLKMHWRVSVGALAHRLYGLGLITEWTYRGLFVQLSRYGRAREPNGIERETSQVFGKVFGSLRQTGTSKADVARALNLYTEDIEALVFGLCTGPVSEGRRVPDAAAARRRLDFKLYK